MKPASAVALHVKKRDVLAAVTDTCSDGVAMCGCMHPDDMDSERARRTAVAIMVRRILHRMPAGELAVEWSRAVRDAARGMEG